MPFSKSTTYYLLSRFYFREIEYLSLMMPLLHFIISIISSRLLMLLYSYYFHFRWFRIQFRWLSRHMLAHTTGRLGFSTTLALYWLSLASASSAGLTFISSCAMSLVSAIWELIFHGLLSPATHFPPTKANSFFSLTSLTAASSCCFPHSISKAALVFESDFIDIDAEV